MRKVLTGPGPDGRSTILSDEPIAEPAPGESRAATEIWMTQALPPELPYVRPKTTEAAEMDVGIPWAQPAPSTRCSLRATRFPCTGPTPTMSPS